MSQNIGGCCGRGSAGGRCRRFGARGPGWNNRVKNDIGSRQRRCFVDKAVFRCGVCSACRHCEPCWKCPDFKQRNSQQTQCPSIGNKQKLNTKHFTEAVMLLEKNDQKSCSKRMRDMRFDLSSPRTAMTRDTQHWNVAQQMT